MDDNIRIANAQAFWGDSSDAPATLLAQQPQIDWLTLDYLAEVSMSILARQRQRDPTAGYARDFLDVIQSLAPAWRNGSRMRLISNAGGLNPRGCAQACVAILRGSGCAGMKMGIVSGDDVLEQLRSDPTCQHYCNLETGATLTDILDRLVSANAYLGAAPLVQAIDVGADIIITGRLADPSLTVAPCMAHFGWRSDDYDRLAGATVAGHLIECGTQATGGISTDWLDVPDAANIGFPIVQVSDDGSCVLSKPSGTGGRVNARTVKEQLVYEIGDPANYISPDVVASFLTLRVQELGDDRVRIGGATGRAPTPFYKVSATYRAGYRASGMLTIVGRDAVLKARRCGQIVLDRLRRAGFQPQRTLVECLGGGDAAPGVLPRRDDLHETVLRITVADERRDVVERFSREIVPLVTGGPQGTSGYFDGRPAVREVFGYWPCLIQRDRVQAQVQVLDV
ncbi:acyclic terpene utilization AtuA family protein [Fontivita pretiosa]|uniref:acyclic terpene utilization AtuA family protein n=1 Tax=Fontivita pretiosa TaxID=2989684 RepID=UPI003D17A4BF